MSGHEGCAEDCTFRPVLQRDDGPGPLVMDEGAVFGHVGCGCGKERLKDRGQQVVEDGICHRYGNPCYRVGESKQVPAKRHATLGPDGSIDLAPTPAEYEAVCQALVVLARVVRVRTGEALTPAEKAALSLASKLEASHGR